MTQNNQNPQQPANEWQPVGEVEKALRDDPPGLLRLSDYLSDEDADEFIKSIEDLSEKHPGRLIQIVLDDKHLGFLNPINVKANNKVYLLRNADGSSIQDLH